ncbi:unnamed protein product [Rotaria magnacalcarata]|uniref:Uncharacterized protein n=1 Tax=Rotaria magnacalcarata TaxID=392030 RepID=A0A815X1C3_9BILA|nr:unnamed protein product [Rotaria magnacalcarata]CAF4337983.1 unnamed protein product [Rotaria magnacalcarata]
MYYDSYYLTFTLQQSNKKNNNNNNSNNIQHQQPYRMKHMLTTTATNYKRNNNNINSLNNINNVNNNNNNDIYHRNHYINKQNNSNIIQRQKSNTYAVNINKYDIQQHSMQQKTNYYQPSKILIAQYPHFLRYKQEFFRKIKIPTELENKKDKICNLSNIHYQAEYFKLESEKWDIYKTVAMNKKKVIELMETIVEDNGNN